MKREIIASLTMLAAVVVGSVCGLSEASLAVALLIILYGRTFRRN